MSRLPVGARSVAKRTVRAVSSTAVRAVGHEVTTPFAARSCLVVAPHPDDETLGCGATIARMRSLGTDVHVVFVTGGGQSPKPAEMTIAELVDVRRAETAGALGALGVEPTAVTHWDYDDGHLPGRCDDIAAGLAALIERLAPEQVLVTSTSDRHPDHVEVGRAARLAVAGGGPLLFEYPIWQRVPAATLARDAARARRDRTGAGPTRPKLVRTDHFLTSKQAAIAAYASQLDHFPLGFVDDFLLRHETFSPVAPG